VWTATEADDTNAHIYTTTRDDHTQYLRTDGSRAATGNVAGYRTGTAPFAGPGFASSRGGLSALRSSATDGPTFLTIGGGPSVDWIVGKDTNADPLTFATYGGGGSATVQMTLDASGNLALSGKLVYPLAYATTAGPSSNGTAGAPTANPAGYIEIVVNGVTYKVPYYNV
jgi:hypothetical protein